MNLQKIKAKDLTQIGNKLFIDTELGLFRYIGKDPIGSIRARFLFSEREMDKWFDIKDLKLCIPIDDYVHLLMSS